MSCYAISNNTVHNSTWQPCPNSDSDSNDANDPFVPCCDRSHAAQCLPGPICYNKYWVRDDGRSTGFSTAACTDESFESGACQRWCAGTSVPNIVYNETSGLWSCCGVDDKGDVDCLNPLDGAFQGESPQKLLGTAYTAPTISSTSAASSTGTTAPNGSTSEEPNASEAASSSSTGTATNAESPNSGGLSVGAKAGIGVGVALGVLAIIVIMYIALRRRRNRSAAGPGSTRVNKATAPAELANDRYCHEAPDHTQPRFEKDGQAVQELSADNGWLEGRSRDGNGRMDQPP